MGVMHATTFAEWYRTARPGLLESVLRAVSRPTVAEDALDTAFERAFARWERVQAMRSPSGWVYRVAVNEARRQLAREVREGERLAFALAGRPPAPPPGGESWLLVDGLPVRQRTAVVLRHVGGMTEAEVATAMGVTRSTVSSTLASAYRTLGHALAEPRERDVSPMDLNLAIAVACDDDGCAIEHLDTGARARAVWSDAVRNTIKVRPGDLVAVDGGRVMWRWWGGTVVALGSDGDASATVERNVTQREPGDARTARVDVDVPADLDVAVGDRVWFGTDDDRKVVVAAGAPESVVARLAPQLPLVSELLR
jgi:RNA polymerase sigma-70 factor (ECF subfamily)